MINAIETVMKNHVIIYGKTSGIYLILEFKNNQKEEWLIKKAKSVNIKVYPVSPIYYNKDNYKGNCVLIGTGSLTEDEIIDAINILNKVWFTSTSCNPKKNNGITI